MEVTTKTITLTGVMIAGAISIAGIAMKNQEMALTGIMVVGTAIGVPVASNKLSSNANTEINTTTESANTEQATSQEETADEVNNDISDLAADTSDKKTSETPEEPTNTVQVQEIKLSQDSINAIADAVTAKSTTTVDGTKTS